MALLLMEAERRYGPRDLSYTPLGILFDRDRPNISYIGKYVTINLSFSAASDPERAYFQLAHEVIHLLSPNEGGHALMIEEGLATIFSDEVSKGKYYTDTQPYLVAKQLLAPILATWPDFIKLAREAQPQMMDWTPDFLEQFVPGYPRPQLIMLCERFRDVEGRMG